MRHALVVLLIVSAAGGLACSGLPFGPKSGGSKPAGDEANSVAKPLRSIPPDAVPAMANDIAYRRAQSVVEEHLGAMAADFPSFAQRPDEIHFDRPGGGLIEVRSHAEAEYDGASASRKRWQVTLRPFDPSNAETIYLKIGDLTVVDRRAELAAQMASAVPAPVTAP